MQNQMRSIIYGQLLMLWNETQQRKMSLFWWNLLLFLWFLRISIIIYSNYQRLVSLSEYKFESTKYHELTNQPTNHFVSVQSNPCSLRELTV